MTSQASELLEVATATYHVVKPFALIIAIALGSTWLAIQAVTRIQQLYGSRASPRSPDPEKRGLAKATERPFGVWEPSPFRRPTAGPYPSWDVHATKPLPYRPFRYGPKYSINMGLRPMVWDDWIELDNHFPRFHADKTRRIAERGPQCSRTAPEAVPAARELLEELAAYLSERYPSLYVRVDGKMVPCRRLVGHGEDEEGDVIVEQGLENLLTGEVFDINAEKLAEDPMQMCARLIQDDLAIMFERDDGQYYLLAGSILLAGFWRLEDKFGMPLSEIHTSGDVPGFREKLEKGMMNFFRRIKPEAPVLRNNYFLQVDDNLAWSDSIGPEDDWTGKVGWASAEKNKAIEHHWFRSERQSLRRLPKSGGVVFTIRTYFHPIVEISEEPYVPGRLASAVRSWGDDVSKYKGRERYQDVLLDFLDRKHQEQVANGLDLSREDEVRAYPY